MKQKINEAVKISNGKKTESLGLLMVAFQALMMLKPDLLNDTTQNTITMVIGSGVVPTLFHRYWRNRKKVGEYISNKIKSLKTAKNK